MMRWAAAVVVLAGTALAASVGEEPASQRDPKLFPVVQIVTFENGPCAAATGEQGTCYSQKECDTLAGTASGTCANGFGVCCVLYATCDNTIAVNGTYFVNIGYPSSIGTPGICSVTLTPPAGTCGGTIEVNNTYFVSPGFPASFFRTPLCFVSLKPPPGTCQILLNFDDFELVGPVAGDCTNDTFVVLGANPGFLIPTLCGFNSGQHMFIDVDNAPGPYKLVTSLSPFNAQRRWKIKVTFININTPCMAPFRCLQYYPEPSGHISSFNFGGTPSMMLNDQAYSICFGYVQGYCDIGISYSRFDLGNVNQQCTGDYVASAGERLCGDFTAFTSQVNATGPANLLVMSDSVNDREEEGFYGSYMMMAC